MGGQIKAFLCAVVAVTAFSCLSPQERAARRVGRILERFPALSDTVTTVTRDTVLDIDTVFIDGIVLDTVVLLHQDSVFIFKEDRVVTEVRIIERETLKVRTEVSPDTLIMVDTVFAERVVIEYKTQVKDTEAPLWALIGTGAAVVLFLLLFVIFVVRLFL